MGGYEASGYEVYVCEYEYGYGCIVCPRKSPHPSPPLTQPVSELGKEKHTVARWGYPKQSLVGWLVRFYMRPPTSGGFHDMCMQQYPKEEHVARDVILSPPGPTDIGGVVVAQERKRTWRLVQLRWLMLFRGSGTAGARIERAYFGVAPAPSERVLTGSRPSYSEVFHVPLILAYRSVWWKS